jgi:CxxC motif-containing protein (DUF1111 family)
MTISRTVSKLVCFAAVAAVTATPMLLAEESGEDPLASAGSFTLKRADADAFAEPAPVLNLRQQEVFMRGRVHFNQKWVVFPSLGGDWGLGPTFIAEKCVECHVKAGRGSPPRAADEQLRSMLVRVSIPGKDEHGRPKPHPNYGDQLQNRALQGEDEYNHGKGDRVPPEASLYLDWQEKAIAFADGETIKLRSPRLRIEKLHFGALGEDIMTSLRLANPIFGLGLLEAVPEETILALANKQAEQGFKGKPNYVWDDINQRQALGRFGWKANQPSVKQQIAAAYLGDIGVTSPLYGKENCPPVQEACAAQPPGNNPELIQKNWDEIEFWTLGLAVPARRNVDDEGVKRGAKLFEDAQCAVCHVPTLKTAAEFKLLPQLANQIFHAYTDLLLHDMGEELADGRPDFQAGPSEWRTAPLWGLGLSETVSGSTAMLHDGRARNATEAILWHGGEAAVSREAFRKMSKPERESLLKFLESI